MIRTRLCPRLAGVTVITAMVVSMIAILSGPALAVPGRQVVTATSPFNSNSAKAVTATCPFPKRVIGTGAEILGAPNVIRNVTLSAVKPLGVNRASATGRENHFAPTGNWQVRVYAICASVPGLQVVQANSPSNPNSPKAVDALCPFNKRLIGTGAEILGAANLIRDVIQTVQPLGPPNGPNRARATGREIQNAPAGSWRVRVYAICASPVPGLQVVTATSPFNSNSAKAVTATCPFPKSVIGTGSLILGAPNVIRNVTLSAVKPLGVNRASATGRENFFAPTGNWQVRVYAICAS